MTENKSLNMPLNIRCSSAESQFLQADQISANHSHLSRQFDVEQREHWEESLPLDQGTYTPASTP
jgi:hypothetical protein